MVTEIAFQPSLYQALNVDLQGLTEEQQLIHHYREHGYHEGRACCEIISREGLISTVSETSRVLEIGAFATPITGHLPHVDHFDVLNRDQLIKRAMEFGFPTHLIPDIRYVDPHGSLEIVPRGLHDVVVSCHVIEHQPCLVRHLNQVMDILPSGGRYLLVIPDKRFVFDQPLPPTRLSEIVDAYVNSRTRHTLTAVIDDAYATSHNDWKRHWAGDHVTLARDVQVVLDAISRYNTGDYVDVHAWRFTPGSLETIVNELTQLGLLTSSFTGKIYPTIYGAHEFFAILQKE